MAKKNPKTLAVDEAKNIAKLRDNYTCQKCGRSKPEVQIHGAHIMPVTYSGTAADPKNIIALCAGCHSMGPNSAHDNPIQFGRWFDEKYPGLYDEMRAQALEYTRNPNPRINWIDKRRELKNELSQM